MGVGRAWQLTTEAGATLHALLASVCGESEERRAAHVRATSQVFEGLMQQSGSSTDPSHARARAQMAVVLLQQLCDSVRHFTRYHSPQFSYMNEYSPQRLSIYEYQYRHTLYLLYTTMLDKEV